MKKLIILFSIFFLFNSSVLARIRTDEITSKNGSLVFSGSENVNNESLTFDFETISNKVLVTTDTGVTEIDFGSINIDVNALTENGNAVYHSGDNQVIDWVAALAGNIHTDNYVENVSTALSVGTVGATTVAISSDGGTDDVILPAATTTDAGLLTAALFDEIVANTAKETNTDTQDLGIAGNNVTLVDGGTADISTITAVAANTAKETNTDDQTAAEVSIADVGSKITAVEVEGALQENRTAIDLNTGKTTESTTVTSPLVLTTHDIAMPAATNSAAGHATAAHITEIEANTLKDTNVSTNLSAGARTATTIDVNSSDGSNATLVEANTTNAGILGSDKWDEIVANTVHAADNSQAHSDYLVNNADDTTTGIITANGFTAGNNDWIAGRNYAGDANINMLKVNVNDEIDVGGTLVSGSLEFTEDSGVATAMDMPVSATPAAGAEQSYTFKIDGENILTVYAEADSSGGIQNAAVVVDTPMIYSQTPQVLTGAGEVNITSAITHIVSTGSNALTLPDGTEGQVKFIVMKTDAGVATLTPSNYANGSTLTFDDVGDSIHLLFTNGAWHWMGGRATSG